VKPVEGFSRSRARADGLNNICRLCKRAELQRYKAARLEHDPTAEKRFWPKVDQNGPNGCWIWKGAVRKLGYGGFMYRGWVQLAHRASLMIHGVELPNVRKTGLVVDHICKVLLCVNPDHLRIITQADNITIYADRSKQIERTNAVWAKNGTSRGAPGKSRKRYSKTPRIES